MKTQADRERRKEMAIAAPGQLNIEESPPVWGSRGVDCFEKLEQIGEGTYGYFNFLPFYFDSFANDYFFGV